MEKQERIDVFLVNSGFVRSRTLASKLISEKRVTVNGKICLKPSEKVSGEEDIKVGESPETRFVSRGGLKLEHALCFFGVSPVGKECIDIGASTGGFTDCLLKNGAKSVLAVDSGSGQLAAELADDKRIVLLENTNARFLTEEVGKFDIAVMDVSFISQTLIFPAVKRILRPDGKFISLIKPQFEAGRENIGKNGIVKSEKARLSVIEKIKKAAEKEGLCVLGITPSPIEGGDGNTEYLALFENVDGTEKV